MQTLISIIVPMYILEQKLLIRCIESLVNQTHKQLEIILVNDGTQEQNIEYIKKIILQDDRIKLIGGINRGLSYARNIGIKEAKGEYLTFVDADDFIDKEYCEKMLRTLISSKSDCVICGYNRVYDNRTEIYNCDDEWNIISGKEFMEKVMAVQEGVGYAHMKLIKKEKLTNTNITFDVDVKFAEDAYFCIQLSEKINYIAHLNEPLYNYYFNTESMVRKYDPEYPEKILGSMEKAVDYIQENHRDNPRVQKLIYNYVAYYVLLVVVNYCYHPGNELNLYGKYKLLKKVLCIDLFQQAIDKSSYEKFSFTRKVTLFTLKYKIYIVTMMIATIRQMQFRSSNN